MSLPNMLATLDTLGINLSVRLVVDAPAGVVTPEIRDALSAYKVLLLERVVREMRWAELSLLRWGPAVGDPEPGIVNNRPGAAPTPAALEVVADGPYAVAEREAIQAE